MTGITATEATKGSNEVMDACRATIAVRNVLFATDFSREADHAISYVRGLHYAFDARVYVVNVVDTFPYNLGNGKNAEIIAQRRAQAEHWLSDYVLSHRFDAGHFSPAVLEGEVFAAIDRFVLQNEIDLIVLGSRAAMGLDRLFLSGPAICGIPAGNKYQLQSHAGTLLREDKMSLLERHRTQRMLESQLRALLPQALQQQVADVIVECGAPAQALAEVSAGIAADLLVLGVRYGGSFLRAATHGLASVTHEVLAKACCPVLTVRSGMTVPDAQA